MAIKFSTAFYPKSIINCVDGNGNAITEEQKGVYVDLWKDKKGICMAEIYSWNCQEYAAIDISIEGGEVVDYSGVFNLPNEVKLELQKHGITC